MPNKHRKGWSTAATSQKLQIKVMRQYFSSTGVANIITTDNQPGQCSLVVEC